MLWWGTSNKNRSIKIKEQIGQGWLKTKQNKQMKELIIVKWRQSG